MNFLTLPVAASGGMLLVGCAIPSTEWKPAGYYVTDQFVFGCDSFEGAKGTVMKKTAVLSQSLQRRLLGMLDVAASADEHLVKDLTYFRDQLLCWYETPEKDIELSIGAFCDAPLRVTFHPQGGDWAISSTSRAIVSCAIRR